MAESSARAIDEWKRYWPVVLAASIGYSSSAFLTQTSGVFMQPLADEFGWSRTQLSSGLTVSSIAAIILSAFVGSLVDRFGARRLALPGLVATTAAVAAFSLANGSFVQWMGFWMVWGICVLMVQATVWTAAVASLFNAGRGLALGLTFAGGALATVIAPPLANWIITNHGWRAAYLWMSLGWGSVAFVLAYFFLFDATGGGSRHGKNRNYSAADSASLPGLTIREAWRNPSLWKVAISTFLILTITVAVSIHQFPILVEAGITRGQAVWLVSMTGIASVSGKLITGALLDRFHARWVGGLTLASTAVAYPLLIIRFDTIVPIVIGIMISGYAAGTKIQLSGYLTARYAGMRNFGAIFGFMTSITGLAAASGPLLAGISYDAYGSYVALLVVGTAISLVSGLLILSLGRYPVWPDVEPATLRAPPAPAPAVPA